MLMKNVLSIILRRGSQAWIYLLVVDEVRRNMDIHKFQGTKSNTNKRHFSKIQRKHIHSTLEMFQ